MPCAPFTDAYWLPIELCIQLYYSIEERWKHAGLGIEECLWLILVLWEKPYISKYIEKTIVSTLQSYIDCQDEHHRESAIQDVAFRAGELEGLVSNSRLNVSMEVIKNLQSMVLSHATSPEHRAWLERDIERWRNHV
jgi:hypothetical protein